MFESAEMEHEVNEKTYDKDIEKLRTELVDAQYDMLEDKKFPVIVIVSGPVNVPTPPGVKRVDVETAEQMMTAVQAEIADTDIFIAAAAAMTAGLPKE